MESPETVIRPPPDFKRVIETVANHVRKGGVQLEAQILAKNATDPKFAFLNPDNPYHNYYKQRLVQEPKEETPSLPKPADMVEKPVPEVEQHQETMSYVDRIALDIDRSRKARDDEHAGTGRYNVFNIAGPSMMTQRDVDLVKLTAQFTARTGREFALQLASREAHNPHFAFLKPSHVFYPYFQRLVDAYELVVTPEQHALQQLGSDISDPFEMQQRILKRANWKRAQLIKEKRKQDEEESSALVDWHSFVLGKAIVFTEDDLHKKNELDVSCLTAEDMNRFVHIALTEDLKAPVKEESMDVSEDDMEMSDEDKPQEESAKPLLDRNVDYQMCPRCQQLIPVNEISEHMRIELLDPRWKEQKKRMEEKHMTTNIAVNDDISKNLGRFAQRNEALQEAPSTDRFVPSWPVQKTQESGFVASTPEPSSFTASAAETKQVPTHPPQRQTTQPTQQPTPSTQHTIAVERPVSKKAKVDQLVSAETWLEMHPENVDVRVIVPLNDSYSHFNLNGQVVSLTIGIQSTVGELKQLLASELGSMPPKKVKLQAPDGQWLKDSVTLASYNASSPFRLTLGVKERGKKK